MGVRQACILSPMLFLIVMDFVMKKSTDHVGVGIPWTDHDDMPDPGSGEDLVAN